MSPTREDVMAFLSQLQAKATKNGLEARETAERHMAVARRSSDYWKARYYASDADRASQNANHHEHEAEMFQAAVLFLEGR